MATDLFPALDALFSKERVEGPPPFYLMHRFLASDPDFAIAARYLQQDIKDQPILFRTWQGMLPTQKRAPHLAYVAPKKQSAEDELTARMMAVLAERRIVVEEMIQMFASVGKLADLYNYFGVEPPEVESSGVTRKI